MNNLKKNKEILIIILIIAIIIFGVFYINRLNRLEEDEQLKEDVLLYFSCSGGENLQLEIRKVDSENIYMNTLKELIGGPEESSLLKTIPDGVKVEEFTLENTLARVSFSRELVDNHWGGSTGERLTVYSIVNTLAQFSEIEEVQILVSGDRLVSLANHMDLTEPVKPDESIVKD